MLQPEWGRPAAGMATGVEWVFSVVLGSDVLEADQVTHSARQPSCGNGVPASGPLIPWVSVSCSPAVLQTLPWLHLPEQVPFEPARRTAVSRPMSRPKSSERRVLTV